MGEGLKRAIAAAKATRQMKLTPPQRKLLTTICIQSTLTWIGYKPAIKLVELGLAKWHAKYKNVLLATEAGIAELKIPTDGETPR